MFIKIINFTIAISLTGCGALNSFTEPAATQSNPISDPSSLPPDGYTADNWIDSRGCAYLRVTNDNWVPKVSRSGSHQCSGVSDHTVIDDITIQQRISQELQNDGSGEVQVVAHIPQTTIQIGVFSVQGNAVAASEKLTQQGYKVITKASPNGYQIVRVISKDGQTPEALLRHMRKLGFADAFIYYG